MSENRQLLVGTGTLMDAARFEAISFTSTTIEFFSSGVKCSACCGDLILINFIEYCLIWCRVFQAASTIFGPLPVTVQNSTLTTVPVARFICQRDLCQRFHSASDVLTTTAKVLNRMDCSTPVGYHILSWLYKEILCISFTSDLSLTSVMKDRSWSNLWHVIRARVLVGRHSYQPIFESIIWRYGFRLCTGLWYIILKRIEHVLSVTHALRYALSAYGSFALRCGVL